MRIAQIIPGLGLKSGGPSRSVCNLTKGLRNIGLEAEILTNNVLTNPNICDESWIKAVEQKRDRPFGYNSRFRSLLSDSSYDIYHIHSVYNYTSLISALVARKKSLPYIIAPRGSMYRNAQKKSHLKKCLFNRLFMINDLNKAAVVHATCFEEMKELRDFGVKAPIAIIPNSLDIPSVFPATTFLKKFRVGFIGRINRIKNIDGLVRAWKISGLDKSSDAELVIVGGADREDERLYYKEIQDYISVNNITNIKFEGFKFGTEKSSLLQSFSVVVLPSHSENFGMVVPEALVYGLPVIASKGTPWNILSKNDCGYWIDNNDTEIANALLTCSQLTIEQRKVIANNAHLLVSEHFSTQSVSLRLELLYKWILGRSKKPDFVYY